MTIDPSSSASTLEAFEDASTSELVREAMDEAKQLVRIEIELAKEEVKDELRHARRAAVAFGIAMGATVIVLCLLAMALVLALGGTAIVALIVAGGFLVVSGTCAGIGYTMLPKSLLEKTRHRLESDVNQLKEHMA